MNIVNIYENYNNYFNSEFKALFELCSKSALKGGYKIYLIGGIVRDLLLAKKNSDIDITVEGDAIEFARFLEREKIASIKSLHQDFGTAKVEINSKNIDLASTRSESYPKKGHLPVVDKIGCTLKEDVLRRDFTINSMAISLNQDDFLTLIDHTQGFEDLQAGKIRILHEQSFIDDPTRIIRALKFSVRLNFDIENTTKMLQEKYLQNVNYDMCYKRVKNELEQTFNLNSQIAFDRFLDEKIYKIFTPNPIKKSGKNIEQIVKKFGLKKPWIVYLSQIILRDEKFEFLMNKLELNKSQKNSLEGAKSLLKIDLKSDFDILKAFGALSVESLAILALENKEREVFRYIDELRNIKLFIDGNDLINLGYSPSKYFSKALDFVLEKKLENPNMSEVEERDLAMDFLKNL